MDLNQLHIAHPLWLWAGIAIPCIGIIFFLCYRATQPPHQLEKFIDSHLLPYLLIKNADHTRSKWKNLLLWSAVWFCLSLALAGPRWNFRDIETFSRDQSLVIVLDLSESMNATDSKPSRLIRAKQKIEDILNLSHGIKIGLLAFAADPHMIAPITEDKETIRHLLSSLETDLVYIQGSQLGSALEMAAQMLEVEPGHNKALLVISDGGFEDASAITTAKKIAEKGVIIHTMGVGTVEGIPLRDHEGKMIKKNGIPKISKLEKERLNEINKVGNGRYLEAHYSDDAEKMILKQLEKSAEAQMNVGKKYRLWEEHFYLFILPVLPVILWWLRRGYVFALFLIFLNPLVKIEAANVYDYFKNSEELGQQALNEGDYEKASSLFQDPYRKGVAYYKTGNFAEAEKMFRQSFREDIACQSLYNLGNAFVQQQKLKEAIDVYEEVLLKWPTHTKAKENLELVKKMLEQQQQDSSETENSDQQDEQNKKESNDKDKSEKQASDHSNKQDNEQQDERQSNSENTDEKPEKPPEIKDKQETQAQHNENVDKEQEEPRETQDKQESQTQHSKKSSSNDQQEIKETEASQQEELETKNSKSQEEQEADFWLNRLTNDPKTFMKNKFYIESKKNATKQGVEPW